MNDLDVIDRYLNVFSQYIDSGFGLLGHEVAFLTATLVVIDMVLAALFWAMGGSEDVIAKLIKKILYVGAFAFIITNFNALSSVLFRSFAGLGLIASGSSLPPSQFLQPGRLAGIGVDAGHPILTQIGELAGFPGVFLNLDSIVVLFLAWLVVLVSFFVLAVQLFVTLIEFKLTTLAGFVLVPFALWNRTAFLAERVLGNVVASGVKVLVLAVIVGIGSNLFAEFHGAIATEPSIDQALAVMLAALSLLGLGIFGPGIATGLVSGAPQLGAGAAAGTALGASGLGVAGGAAIAGGARLAASGGGAALRSATTLAGGARAAYAEGKAASGASGMRATAAGLSNVARSGLDGLARRGEGRSNADGSSSSPNATATSGGPGSGERDAAADHPPAWAQRLHRRQQLTQGVSTAAHVLRSSDHGGGGASPRLGQEEGN
ncbi:MAG: P-type conjugative transfer protein TrbL [Candidatus Eremiobacteraeota bacterium]|nr:P-type conjugative transfer protein TrbL [Candidatus Eremiobacteraeota bacterium]